MKFDVLRAMRNATRQTRSGHLMDATRAILERLQGSSPSRNSVEAGLESHEEANGSSDSSRSVQESVLEGEFFQVDAHPPEAESAGTARPVADIGESFSSGDFTFAAASLHYRLYLPPASVRNGALLLMLHGCTQEATDFSAGTAMNTLARDSGYAVLYPTQNAASNPNRCWNWFLPAHQQRNAGEPALLSALTQSICKQQGLNPSRVYVAGLSAGGAMALILAEEYPDIYAGVGVHSGLPTGMANSVPQALRAMTGGGTPAPLNPDTIHRPTLVIHGDQDTTVHPHNASLIVQRCLAQYRQQHAGVKLLYRCHEEAVGGQSAQYHEYRNHEGLVVCRHLKLRSVGHAWSGGDASGSHTSVGGMSASQALLDFFEQCSCRSV